MDNNLSQFELEDIALIANQKYQWNKLRNSTILISGGTGFIGSLFVQVLQFRNENFNDNIRIKILSRSGGVNSTNVEFIQHDICNPLDIKADYIIHAASNTHPKLYAEKPVETIMTNFSGCYNLLENARKYQAKRFMLLSSVEIYGDSNKIMDEESCGYINCNTARSGYNESKRLSESLCQSYLLQYGIDCVVARLSRCFGVDKTKKDSKVMAQFFSNVASGEDIILKSLGQQKFSYCYITDAVLGLIKVLLDGKTGEAYNICENNNDMTLKDYAHFIANLNQVKVIVDIPKENQKGISTSNNALISNDKLKKLGWEPIYTIKEGLIRTYNLLKSELE